MTDSGSDNLRAITDAEWRKFQAIPDQGYSHRAWVDSLVERRVAAATAPLEAKIAEALDFVINPFYQGDNGDVDGNEVRQILAATSKERGESK